VFTVERNHVSNDALSWWGVTGKYAWWVGVFTSDQRSHVVPVFVFSTE